MRIGGGGCGGQQHGSLSGCRSGGQQVVQRIVALYGSLHAAVGHVCNEKTESYVNFGVWKSQKLQIDTNAPANPSVYMWICKFKWAGGAGGRGPFIFVRFTAKILKTQSAAVGKKFVLHATPTMAAQNDIYIHSLTRAPPQSFYTLSNTLFGCSSNHPILLYVPCPPKLCSLKVPCLCVPLVCGRKVSPSGPGQRY